MKDILFYSTQNNLFESKYLTCINYFDIFYPEVVDMKDIEKEIALLQENLEMLRKLFGWSAEQLGNRLGVTKQTVLNLEHGKPIMSKIQYIAIRAVFETEANIREEEEKRNLLTVMNLIFNEDNKVSEKKKKDALDAAKVMANATLASKDKAMVTKTMAGALAGIGIAAGALMPIAGAVAGSLTVWLAKMLKDENDK